MSSIATACIEGKSQAAAADTSEFVEIEDDEPVAAPTEEPSSEAEAASEATEEEKG